MSDLPWSFFDQFDHGIGDLNPSVPMSFPHTETVEASSASEAELILLQFMVDAAATPPLHSAELGTLQPLPADPLASTGFTSVAERERLENHITEIFAAPAPPPPPAVPALPPVALTRPAFQPLLPSQSMVSAAPCNKLEGSVLIVFFSCFKSPRKNKRDAFWASTTSTIRCKWRRFG